VMSGVRAPEQRIIWNPRVVGRAQPAEVVVSPQVMPQPQPPSAGGWAPEQRIIWNPRIFGQAQPAVPVRKKGLLQRLGEAFAG